MNILHDKGLMSFIKEAIKSNKSMLNRGYNLQRSIFPDKNNPQRPGHNKSQKPIGLKNLIRLR